MKNQEKVRNEQSILSKIDTSATPAEGTSKLCALVERSSKGTYEIVTR